MSLSSFSAIGKAIHDTGKYHYQYVYKVATPIPGTAGFFVDMNQTSGSPKYNAFAGTQFAFTRLEGSGNGGIYTGANISGSSKHLASLQVLNPNTGANTVPPDHIILSDYLGFYPLIDGDDTDLQIMDNTVSLSRYVSGVGVRIVLIVQAPMTTTAPVTITYTNSDGVTGRSVTFNLIPGVNIGVCATASGPNGLTQTATPFARLDNGDVGVRAIESIQLGSGAGGFFCAALVSPLASIMTLESGVAVEEIYGIAGQLPPEIIEGAYLNFLIKRSGSLAGRLQAQLVFINS